MSRRGWILFAIACAISIGAAHLADGWGLAHAHLEGVNGEDWGRVLRALGYLPMWFVVGLVFLLIDSGRKHAPPTHDRWARGVLVVLGALSGGLVSEGLKLVVRRERPFEGPAGYSFRTFAEHGWSSAGIGMPSSHAAVAAGALTALALLHPRAGAVFALLAAGCGATRVLAGAHYISDVVAGIAVGAACALAWWTLHVRGIPSGTEAAT